MKFVIFFKKKFYNIAFLFFLLTILSFILQTLSIKKKTNLNNSLKTINSKKSLKRRVNTDLKFRESNRNKYSNQYGIGNLLENQIKKFLAINNLNTGNSNDEFVEYKNFSEHLILKCKNKNDFALTWDDGPEDKLTHGILDVLKLKNVTATFFIVAKRLNWEPHAIAAQRAYKEGHQIATHSFNHENLTHAVSEKKNCTELKHQFFER